MAPSEILGDIDRPGWCHHYWVATSVYGGVLGGCWNLSRETRAPVDLTRRYEWVQYEKTIADRYDRANETASVDPDGFRRTYHTPYSAGTVRKIVPLYHNSDTRMLSRRIRLDPKSLNEILRQ